MNYQFCFRADPGRLRPNNEDAIVLDEARRLAVLADGMGGYNAGEVASSMATSLLGAELGRWLAEAGPQASATDLRRAVEICVRNANSAIFQAARDNPQYSGMGTTLVVAVFRDDSLMLGHVGDSRCYRLRDGDLTQITRDHSLLQEQLDAGRITPEQAAVSIHRNLVTRALGVEEEVRLELNEHPVSSGDLYLICSDGLSDMVDDGTIAALLAQEGSIEDKAAALVGAANARGGRDNIAVLLAQARAAMPRRGLLSWLAGG